MNNYNRYLKSFFGSIVFAIYINIGILVGWIEIVHQYRGLAAFIMIIIAWTAYKSGEEIGLPQGLAFLIGMAILFSHLIVLLLKGYITIDVTQQIGGDVSVGGWIKLVLFACVSFLFIVLLGCKITLQHVFKENERGDYYRGAINRIYIGMWLNGAIAIICLLSYLYDYPVSKNMAWIIILFGASVFIPGFRRTTVLFEQARKMGRDLRIRK